MKVVQLMGVYGNVGGRGVKGRRLDQADHGPFGHLFRRNVRPILSAIARDMKKAIVASGPKHTILLGRFRQAEYHVVILDGVLIFRDGAAGILLLGFVITSEVRTDGGPRATLIGGTENELRAVIDHVGVVLRNKDRHGPGIAVFLFYGRVTIRDHRPLLDALGLTGAAIEASEDGPLVVGVNDVRIVGVNPQTMMIAVRRVQTIPGLAAIYRAEEPGASDVEGVYIFWVGPDMGEIPGTLAEAVVVGDERPVIATVVRAIESAFFCFNERVNNIRIGAGNGHADASERALGDAVAFDALPGGAVVVRT